MESVESVPARTGSQLGNPLRAEVRGTENPNFLRVRLAGLSPSGGAHNAALKDTGRANSGREMSGRRAY